ncbi:hypothetical protein D9611_004471 [Ephemerocybe angulata]|uniref:Mini-chromosome maintenance complex-binding protein n=1 Tax=Ephemerocybe angulata TaxID=980116 RepID=A0A8H5BJR6_9AGAR|nr:hypothetical protein D9611_004471 [Tulosesus angulatus]
MVSSLLVDALARPSVLLQDLANVPDDAQDLPARVSKYFGDIFASDDAFNEITQLGLETPPESLTPRSLVRFDAMVQDTACSPEIYLSKRSSGECGGWGLNEHDATDDDPSPVDYNLLRECNVIWAVSIPGQSPWSSSQGDLGVAPSTTPAPSPLSHKYPLPSTAHLGVQIKIYDSTLAEPIRTTDLYSFVGILTSDPWHTSSETVTLVPTIHVLFARQIASTIVPRAFPASFESPVREVREHLISWVADEALAGDKLAAEWVLLAVMSKVQSRAPPILPLSLNLTGFGPSTASNPKLTHVLSQLVPMLAVLPLSLNVVNSTTFVPESKDEDLHSGWLQLPKGSLCIVSEVSMDEGTVSQKGVYNLRTIQDTMSNQTLDYVFPFSQFSFETDISFLVLSAGKKSPFFRTQLQVPLRGSTDTGLYAPDASLIRLPSPETLSEYRNLIGGGKIANITLEESTAKFIQDDFVKERQAASSKNAGKTGDVVTSDDLIIRMMVAKLLAASYHRPEVTREIWEEAKALDERRKARLD